MITFLDDPSQFSTGPKSFLKGNTYDDYDAFTVIDANLVTARWPGGMVMFHSLLDAYKFAKDFMKLLQNYMSQEEDEDSLLHEEIVQKSSKQSLAFINNGKQTKNPEFEDILDD